MKSANPLITKLAVAMPPAPRPAFGSRPVRRGSFWPGESFNAYTNKWDLTGAFAGQAFVLPTLGGSKGSQTL